MKAATTAPESRRARLLHLAARLSLGAIFVYLGAIKAADPVGFLKLVRAFEAIDTAPALNVVAAVLPWLEIFCGAMLMVGWKARGAALLQLAMLFGFTVLVAVRAIALHRSGTVAFCDIAFDCGCGTGEVRVCLKLLENTAMMGLAGFVVWR